jgi:hypothetical protein
MFSNSAARTKLPASTTAERMLTPESNRASKGGRTRVRRSCSIWTTVTSSDMAAFHFGKVEAQTEGANGGPDGPESEISP